MFTHLLVPTDGSRVGSKAVMEGIGLAKALGARMTILTVVRPFHTFSLDPELMTETSDEHQKHEEGHVREDMRLADQAASSAGVKCEHVTAERDHLSDAVIEAAKNRGCDLVVMPAHERVGLIRSSHVDTQTVRLLAHSELPVLVLHDRS